MEARNGGLEDLAGAYRDEQMSKKLPFSLLNDEQMSNWLGVEHLPEMVFLFNWVIFRFHFGFRGCIYFLSAPTNLTFVCSTFVEPPEQGKLFFFISLRMYVCM